MKIDKSTGFLYHNSQCHHHHHYLMFSEHLVRTGLFLFTHKDISYTAMLFAWNPSLKKAKFKNINWVFLEPSMQYMLNKCLLNHEWMMNILMLITIIVMTIMANILVYSCLIYVISHILENNLLLGPIIIIPVLHMQTLKFREVIWFSPNHTVDNKDLGFEPQIYQTSKFISLIKNREPMNLGDSHPLQRHIKLLLCSIYLKIEQNLSFQCWLAWRYS